MTYQHTQRAPLGHLVMLVAIVMGVAAWFAREEAAAAVALYISAGVCLLLSQMFQTLTITDGGDFLGVRFGPISIFQQQIQYVDITAVEVDCSSWIDGWGIHWLPGRGTTWNLWGFGCVKLTVNGKTMRIGSDDAQQLAAFVRERISSTSG